MSCDTTLNGKVVFESDWLGSVDLAGKDRVVEIEKVEIADLFNPRTNKKKKTLTLRIKGELKGFICNQTNATTIGGVLKVTEASKWPGHRVTLYPTTCQVGRETKTCIRVRETLPVGKGAKQEPSQPADHTLLATFNAMKARWKSRREDRGESTEVGDFRAWVADTTSGIITADNALSVAKYTAETIEHCESVIRDTMPEQL